MSESIARIQDSHRGLSNQVLYLIQDAHTNPSAQRNIAKTIDRLLEKEKIQTVYVEGGFGDVSLSALKASSSLQMRQDVGMRYLRKGELSGAEFLSLTSAKDFHLWGVENEKLYWKSVELYRTIASQRVRLNAYLANTERTVETLKPEILHPLLRSFDRQRNDFLDGKSSFAEYFSKLLQLARWMNVSLGDYPELEKIATLRQKEASINFVRANDEASQAIRFISKRDPNFLTEAGSSRADAAKRTSKSVVSAEAFYLLLGEKLKRTSAPEYPELSRYLNYLKDSRDLDLPGMLSEQNRLEASLFEKLIQTKNEEKIIQAGDALRRWNALLALNLLPDSFEEISLKGETSLKEVTGYLNSQIMALEGPYDRVVFLDEGFEKTLQAAEEFYQLTQKRDEIFVDHILGQMTERVESKAILVAGGYHSPDLKKILREKNISFVCLSPQVLNETNIARYEKLLLGGIKKREAVGNMAVGANHISLVALMARDPDAVSPVGPRTFSRELAADTRSDGPAGSRLSQETKMRANDAAKTSLIAGLGISIGLFMTLYTDLSMGFMKSFFVGLSVLATNMFAFRGDLGKTLNKSHLSRLIALGFMDGNIYGLIRYSNHGLDFLATDNAILVYGFVGSATLVAGTWIFSKIRGGDDGDFGGRPGARLASQEPKQEFRLPPSVKEYWKHFPGGWEATKELHPGYSYLIDREARIVQTVKEYLSNRNSKEGAVLVEIAPGRGRLFSQLAELPGVSRAFAVDINPNALEALLQRTREKGISRKKVVAIQGDIDDPKVQEKIPVADVIVINDAMMHLPRLESFLDLVWLRLKPGGIFVGNTISKEGNFFVFHFLIPSVFRALSKFLPRLFVSDRINRLIEKQAIKFRTYALSLRETRKLLSERFHVRSIETTRAKGTRGFLGRSYHEFIAEAKVDISGARLAESSFEKDLAALDVAAAKAGSEMALERALSIFHKKVNELVQNNPGLKNTVLTGLNNFNTRRLGLRYPSGVSRPWLKDDALKFKDMLDNQLSVELHWVIDKNDIAFTLYGSRSSVDLGPSTILTDIIINGEDVHTIYSQGRVTAHDFKHFALTLDTQVAYYYEPHTEEMVWILEKNHGSSSNRQAYRLKRESNGRFFAFRETDPDSKALSRTARLGVLTQDSHGLSWTKYEALTLPTIRVLSKAKNVGDAKDILDRILVEDFLTRRLQRSHALEGLFPVAQISRGQKYEVKPMSAHGFSFSQAVRVTVGEKRFEFRKTHPGKHMLSMKHFEPGMSNPKDYTLYPKSELTEFPDVRFRYHDLGNGREPVLLVWNERMNQDVTVEGMVSGARLTSKETPPAKEFWLNSAEQKAVFSREDFQTAARSVSKVVKRTPLLRLLLLSGILGKPVFLKDESVQSSGSFKMRGVYYEVESALRDLAQNHPEKLDRGVRIVTQSTGNHGIALIRSVSIAIRQLSREFPALTKALKKTEPVVFTYQGIPSLKRDEMQRALEEYRQKWKASGGSILDSFKNYDEAKKARLLFIEQSKGQAFYMDHGGRDILLGHGSAGLEIVEQLREQGIGDDKQVVLIEPVGEGGPIGIGASAKTLRKGVSQVIVQSNDLNAFVRSLQTGQIEKNHPFDVADLVADGIAVDAPDPYALDVAKSYVDAAVAIEEKEAIHLSQSILEKDLEEYYPGASRIHIGGTTALTAGALIKYNQALAAIRRADVVVILGAERNPSVERTTLLPDGDSDHGGQAGGALYNQWIQSSPLKRIVTGINVVEWGRVQGTDREMLEAYLTVRNSNSAVKVTIQANPEGLVSFIGRMPITGVIEGEYAKELFRVILSWLKKKNFRRVQMDLVGNLDQKTNFFRRTLDPLSEPGKPAYHFVQKSGEIALTINLETLSPDRATFSNESGWTPLKALDSKIDKNDATGQLRFDPQNPLVKLPEDVTFIQVRHGETFVNQEHVFQGQKETELSRLNPEGIRQAERAAEILYENLKGALERGEDVWVVSSPLERSLDTAERFVRLVKQKTGQDVSVDKEPLLKEISWGILDGKDRKDYEANPALQAARKLYDQEFTENRNAFTQIEGSKTYYENLLETRALLEVFLEKVRRRKNTNGGRSLTIVGFGHGTRYTMISALFGDKSVLDDSGTYIDFWKKKLPNGEPRIFNTQTHQFETLPVSEPSIGARLSDNKVEQALRFSFDRYEEVLKSARSDRQFTAFWTKISQAIHDIVAENPELEGTVLAWLNDLNTDLLVPIESWINYKSLLNRFNLRFDLNWMDGVDALSFTVSMNPAGESDSDEKEPFLISNIVMNGFPVDEMKLRTSSGYLKKVSMLEFATNDRINFFRDLNKSKRVWHFEKDNRFLEFQKNANDHWSLIDIGPSYSDEISHTSKTGAIEHTTDGGFHLKADMSKVHSELAWESHSKTIGEALKILNDISRARVHVNEQMDRDRTIQLSEGEIHEILPGKSAVFYMSRPHEIRFGEDTYILKRAHGGQLFLSDKTGTLTYPIPDALSEINILNGLEIRRPNKSESDVPVVAIFNRSADRTAVIARVSQGARLSTKELLEHFTANNPNRFRGLNVRQVSRVIGRSRNVIYLYFAKNPQDVVKYGIVMPKKYKNYVSMPLEQAGRVRLSGLNLMGAAEVLGVHAQTLAKHLKIHPEYISQYGITPGSYVKTRGARLSAQQIEARLDQTEKAKLAGMSVSAIAKFIQVETDELWRYLKQKPEAYERYGIRRHYSTKERLERFAPNNPNRYRGLTPAQVGRLIGSSHNGVYLHLAKYPSDVQKYGIIMNIKYRNQISVMIEQAGPKRLQGLNYTRAAELLDVHIQTLVKYFKAHPEDIKRYGIVPGSNTTKVTGARLAKKGISTRGLFPVEIISVVEKKNYLVKPRQSAGFVLKPGLVIYIQTETEQFSVSAGLQGDAIQIHDSKAKSYPIVKSSIRTNRPFTDVYFDGRFQINQPPIVVIVNHQPARSLKVWGATPRTYKNGARLADRKTFERMALNLQFDKDGRASVRARRSAWFTLDQTYSIRTASNQFSVKTDAEKNTVVLTVSDSEAHWIINSPYSSDRQFFSDVVFKVRFREGRAPILTISNVHQNRDIVVQRLPSGARLAEKGPVSLNEFAIGTYAAFPTLDGQALALSLPAGLKVFSFKIDGSRLSLLERGAEQVVTENLPEAVRNWRSQHAEKLLVQRDVQKVSSEVKRAHQIMKGLWPVNPELMQTGFVGIDLAQLRAQIKVEDSQDSFKEAVQWMFEVLAARGGNYYMHGVDGLSDSEKKIIYDAALAKKNFATFSFIKPENAVVVNIHLENGEEAKEVSLRDHELVLRTQGYDQNQMPNLEAAVAIALEVARIYQNGLGQKDEKTIEELNQSKIPQAISNFSDRGDRSSRPRGRELDAYFRGSLEHAEAWTIKPIRIFVRLAEALRAALAVDISA